MSLYTTENTRQNTSVSNQGSHHIFARIWQSGTRSQVQLALALQGDVSISRAGRRGVQHSDAARPMLKTTLRVTGVCSTTPHHGRWAPSYIHSKNGAAFEGPCAV